MVLHLLETIFSADESPELVEAIALEPLDDLPSFDEQGALVLIAGHGLIQSVAEGEPPQDLTADLSANSLRSVNSSAVGGMDLPGFVRR